MTDLIDAFMFDRIDNQLSKIYHLIFYFLFFDFIHIFKILHVSS